jgi:WD40 repeat protein
MKKTIIYFLSVIAMMIFGDSAQASEMPICQVPVRISNVKPIYPEMLMSHLTEVYSVDFSPDGTLMATGSKDSIVRIWNIETGQCIMNLSGHSSESLFRGFIPRMGNTWLPVHQTIPPGYGILQTGKNAMTFSAHSAEIITVAFSPNGKYLATGSLDNTARIWDLETRKEYLTLSGHTADIPCVAFSPDGKQIATASRDKTVGIWDVKTGKRLMTLSGHSGPVSSVAFSPDGIRLATGSWDNTVRIWDAENGKSIKTLSGHSDIVFSVVFSPDGTKLASGSKDHTVTIWNANTGDNLLTITNHSDSVYSVSFSPDGKKLAAASRDKTVQVWDANTDIKTMKLSGHTDSINSVAFSPDGKRLATASADRTVKIWDIKTGKNIKTLSGRSGGLTSLKYSPDGKRLATGSYDKTAKLWDTESGRHLATLSGHSDSITCLDFSPDGTLLATVSTDHTLYIWDVNTAQNPMTFSKKPERVKYAAFSPDGGQLAVIYSNRLKRRNKSSSTQRNNIQKESVWIFDLKNEKKPMELFNTHDTIYSMDYSPNGERLAVSSEKGVQVWDTKTGKNLMTIKNRQDFKTVIKAVLFNGLIAKDDFKLVAFSPDGSRLATSKYRVVQIWDANTGQCLNKISDFYQRVNTLAFSPGGRQLATGSMDRSARIWDVETGHCLMTFSRCIHSARSVAFSPDSTQLATGLNSNDVRIWNAKTGQWLKTLSGHSFPVTSLEFSSDGSKLVSGSFLKTFIWDAKTWDKFNPFPKTYTYFYFVSFSPDRTQLIVPFDSNTDRYSAKIFDIIYKKELMTLSGHSHLVCSAAFSPDGELIATASGDKTARIWDAKTGKTLLTFSGIPITKYLYSLVAFSPDGEQLITPYKNNTARIWNVKTGKSLMTFSGHSNNVLSAKFSPDGNRIATISKDSTARIWNAKTGKNLTTLPHFSNIFSFAFSPDGTCIASGAYNSFNLWNAFTGKLLSKHYPLPDNQYAIYYPDQNALSGAFSSNSINYFSSGNVKTDILPDGCVTVPSSKIAVSLPSIISVKDHGISEFPLIIENKTDHPVFWTKIVQTDEKSPFIFLPAEIISLKPGGKAKIFVSILFDPINVSQPFDMNINGMITSPSFDKPISFQLPVDLQRSYVRNYFKKNNLTSIDDFVELFIKLLDGYLSTTIKTYFFAEIFFLFLIFILVLREIRFVKIIRIVGQKLKFIP